MYSSKEATVELLYEESSNESENEADLGCLHENNEQEWNSGELFEKVFFS